MQNVLRTNETHIHVYQRNLQIYDFIKKRRAALSPSCTNMNRRMVDEKKDEWEKHEWEKDE